MRSLRRISYDRNHSPLLHPQQESLKGSVPWTHFWKKSKGETRGMRKVELIYMCIRGREQADRESKYSRQGKFNPLVL